MLTTTNKTHGKGGHSPSMSALYTSIIDIDDAWQSEHTTQKDTFTREQLPVRKVPHTTTHREDMQVRLQERILQECPILLFLPYLIICHVWPHPLSKALVGNPLPDGWANFNCSEMNISIFLFGEFIQPCALQCVGSSAVPSCSLLEWSCFIYLFIFTSTWM